MLKYKEYRHKFTEDATEVAENPQSDISKKIDDAIDQWIASLKSAFMTNEPKNRGLWDRFKNTMANLWHGRNDPGNPYKYVNKFGDNLGQTQESVSSLSVADYTELKSICESLEELLEDENPMAGTENLRLMRIIDQKGQELKDTLKRIIGQNEPESQILDPDDDPVIPQTPHQDAPIQEPQAVEPKTAQSPVQEPQPQEPQPQEPSQTPVQPPVDPERAKRLKNHSMAVNVFPKTPEGGTPWENMGDDEKYTTRPTPIEKQWKDLNDEEKEKWNVYGGGVERKITRKPLKDLPWILRIGDPRLTYLKQFSGNQRRINTLERDGRIESYEHPIKSKQELEERVKQIKNMLQQRSTEVENDPRFKLHKDNLAHRNPVEETPPTPEVAPAPEVQKPVEETPPPPPEPEKKSNEPYAQQFKAGDIPPESVKHTPDNSLGPTAHKQDYKIGDMGTGQSNPADEPKAPESPQTPQSPQSASDDFEDDALIDDDKVTKDSMMDYLLDKKNHIRDENTRNNLLMQINKLKKRSPREEYLAVRDAIWDAIQKQELEDATPKESSKLSFSERIAHFKQLLKNNR